MMIPYIDSTTACNTVNYGVGTDLVADPIVELPKKFIVGYCNWNQCDDSIITAVQQGVNVLIWFAINLDVDKTNGKPLITNGPDMDCVASIVHRLETMNLPTIHLISIGGWNSPHPDTRNDVSDVYQAWHRWNKEIAARPDKGFYGFHGIDWDIEGNDDISSQYNTFTSACLDLMGQFSRSAKKDGYIVSMAPAESYLDPTTTAFSLSVAHDYPEYKELQPDFKYHGRNVYAYLLSKYWNAGIDSYGNDVDTFDFVTIQLYEGYSHALYNITINNGSVTEYLNKIVGMYRQGWEVNFQQEPSLKYGTGNVSIAANKLVIGLANGWAGDGKFIFISTADIQKAYNHMHDAGDASTVRGFAYWNILDEGKNSVYMASELNTFLQIRDTISNDGTTISK